MGSTPSALQTGKDDLLIACIVYSKYLIACIVYSKYMGSHNSACNKA